MEIQTKFSIGNTVFCARILRESQRLGCPDCLGSKEWKVIAPSGQEYTTPCPRCSGTYQSDRGLSLDHPWWKPYVTKLTIGSVRTDTEKDGDGNTYMCVETGVGSGSVYDERDLFFSEDAAQAAADNNAAEQNSKDQFVLIQYNKALKISDYQLGDAKIELAKEIRDSARDYRSDVYYAVQHASDLDDAKERLEKLEEN